MPDGQFDQICDAGVELVRALTAILKSHGIGLEHASSVIGVAAAGVAKDLRLDLSEMTEIIASVSHMWRPAKAGEESGVVFDPAHRRPDFVPIVRDATLGN